jgi:hypothetical protein
MKDFIPCFPIITTRFHRRLQEILETRTALGPLLPPAICAMTLLEVEEPSFTSNDKVGYQGNQESDHRNNKPSCEAVK